MKRLTEKRGGENSIPLRNAACGIDMPHWYINKTRNKYYAGKEIINGTT